ncbi:hypothetical protein NORO109296_18075 [Nocardiopsis rhodophaea]
MAGGRAVVRVLPEGIRRGRAASLCARPGHRFPLEARVPAFACAPDRFPELPAAAAQGRSPFLPMIFENDIH